ncbi:unnamed protein product [Rotaria socialis]
MMLRTNIGNKTKDNTTTSSQSTKQVTTTIATRTAAHSSSSFRSGEMKIMQNFLLIWFDGNTDKNHEYFQDYFTKLRNIVSTLEKFNNVNRCVEYLRSVEFEKVFLIVSETLNKDILPLVHDMIQIDTIFFLTRDKKRHKQLKKKWSKVQIVPMSVKSICKRLNKAVRECDHNVMPMSFVPKRTSMETTFDQFELSFICSILINEIILDTKEDDTKCMKDLVAYCRQQNISESQLKHFQRKYNRKSPIWWYTYECFLFSMLNKAVCSMDLECMSKLGFFIRNLNRQLEQLHKEQSNAYKKPITVYRGQELNKEEFEDLINTKDGLLMFNNFFSASSEQHVAMKFVRRSLRKNENVVIVLFVMTIDPKKVSTSVTPFANIDDYSVILQDDEILFAMNTMFLVKEIKKSAKNNHLWEVALTLIDVNDPQLAALTHRMREHLSESTGWQRLGDWLLNVGQYQQAEELYIGLLKNSSCDKENAYVYQQLGLIKYNQQEYTEAVSYYKKSLKIYQEILCEDDQKLGAICKSVAMAYEKLEDQSNALKFFEKAHDIYKKVLPANHPDLSTLYRNIGQLYNSMGNYSKTLEFYEKASAIQEKTLTSDHLDLAASYDNIASVYNNAGDFSNALEFYDKALKIKEKTLNQTEPSLASSYNNIGSMHCCMDDHKKALKFFKKARKILEKIMPANDPDLASFYSNIGKLYDNMGKYSKAIKFYEKTLKIDEITLPLDHPSLATSYNSMGQVYSNKGDYSKALEYYTKAIKIRAKVLPPNHPDLAFSKHDIGVVCENMGDYSMAKQFYEWAFSIGQLSLPPDHPHLHVYQLSLDNVKTKM